MTVTVDFYFDFGSPNAYLAWHAVPGIEQRTGARFDLRPALLGGVFKATNNRSPVEAFAGIPAKLAYDRREIERFIARHDLRRFRMNPFFPINTLAMMRGAWAARTLDVFDRYVAAVSAGMWERGLDMGDVAVFTGVLDEAGLPSADILARSQDPAVKQMLIDETQRLVERGGFGIPSFFVGDEMFFGKDRLREVEDEIVRRQGNAAI
ncbi:MAG: 2-hydroxychromene-2-carboxylate isomerase [Sphingomonas paucimobilis]